MDWIGWLIGPIVHWSTIT